MDDQAIKDELFHINRNFFKPRKIEPEQTVSHLYCKCHICDSDRKLTTPAAPKNQAKEDYANYEGQEQSFTWLVSQLGKASSESQLKLNIPETVVFRRSRPSFIIQQKLDRSLKFTTNPSKLKLQDLKKLISNIVKQRKRDDIYHRPSKLEGYSRDIALVKYMNREYDNECEFIHPSFEEGALRVMNENEFNELMIERPGSSIWKKICYIQAVVKCKQGIGETFNMTYYSHDINDAQAILELQKAGKDENDIFESLYSKNIQKYAEYVCRKIAFVLAVNSQLEILRMCPEFLMDDNGKIWLLYVSRLSVKKIDIQDKEQDVVFKKVELRSVESKERLNDELHNVFSDLKTPHQTRMLSEMSKHYLDLKAKIGIDQVFHQQPKDPLSNQAFSVLRPFSPYSIYDLIDPESLKKIEESHRKIKRQKIRLQSRPNLRLMSEEKSPTVWSFGNKPTVSSVRSLKTSSRFSERLKSWLTPKSQLG